MHSKLYIALWPPSPVVLSTYLNNRDKALLISTPFITVSMSCGSFWSGYCSDKCSFLSVIIYISCNNCSYSKKLTNRSHLSIELFTVGSYYSVEQFVEHCSKPPRDWIVILDFEVKNKNWFIWTGISPRSNSYSSFVV